MYNINELKVIKLILHITLAVLLILLFTQRLWVTPLVNYVVVHFYGVPAAYVL